MTSLQSLFSKLDDLGLKLAESVKCMILLAALPKSWENLAASILANKTLETIKLDPIVGIIREEFARRHQSETGLISRISGVKRKGNNPNWSEQKQAKQPKQEQTSGGPKPEQKKTDAAADEGEKKKKKAEKRKAKKAKKAAAAAAGLVDFTLAAHSSF
ncbi:hypothetical protein MPER_11455 [Moniliophthora perniciosa FA553]|nr:hypothetical protein MPER_11455 [Moniliophthora perniciosa FA553]